MIIFKFPKITSFPENLRESSSLFSHIKYNFKVFSKCVTAKTKIQQNNTHEAEGFEDEQEQEVLGFVVFRVCIYLSIYLSQVKKRCNRVARMSGSEQVQSVEVEKTASPSLPPAAAVASSSSCRKKKSDTTSTTFFGDVVDHIDEFVHASMDEHKDCLKKTLNKVNFCL